MAGDGQKPLRGVKVLDLTNVLAGPFACHQLVQMGAEVIKIEMPGTGDLARQLGLDADLNDRGMGISYLAQNVGKASVAIDLKAAAGKALLLRMVAGADVLVENFRPGVMDRLGLGYEVLKAANEALIYCAISGYGQEGPWADRPAYDQIVQGLSGVMSITGDAQSAPLRAGYPVADTMGGMTAAFAIAAALNARPRGCFVDVSMLDAVLASMGWAVSNFLIGGVEPTPHGNENYTSAPSATYRTGDGLLNIAANKQEQWEALARLIGRADLIGDARFLTREDRKAHRPALTREIEAGLATASAADWSARLNAAGVPAGQILSVPQILSHPQVEGRDMVETFPDPPGVGRAISVVTGGYKVNGSPTRAGTPPPLLGQDTERVLEELGLAPDEIAALKDEGVIG